jgi:hypothetical protein
VPPTSCLRCYGRTSAELMHAYPVDARVGNIRNNNPELLRELAA